MQRDPIELALLLDGGVLVAADLFVLGGIPAAAVDARQLRFQPRAHRIGRYAGRSLLLRRRSRIDLCPGFNAHRADAAKRRAGQDRSEKYGGECFRHVR